MKTTLTRCSAAVIFTFAAFISYSQTSWLITGNGNITNSNFIGTTNSIPFIMRTNNKERLRIIPNGNVGIGTKTPVSKFDVAGTISGFDSYFGKRFPISAGTSGASYSSVGYGLNFTDTTANYRYRIDNDFSSMVSFRAGGFDFNTAPIGTAGSIIPYTTVMTILQNGNVGIGTSTPAYKFFVTAAAGFGTSVALIENTVGDAGNKFSDGLYIKAGSPNIAGSRLIMFLRPDGLQIGRIDQASATSVSYQTISDKRLKNIIGTSQKGLSDLMKIKIYDYTFKSDGDKKVLTGFMAQELYDVFPQSVSKPRANNESAEKDPWMIDYGSVTPLIIKSVQEQQHMIDDLKKQNEKLQKQIDELKAMLISKSSERVNDNQTAFK
jgi:hypothetical protein